MFRSKVFTGLKKNLTRAILAEISKDRDGEMVNREMLKLAIQIYVDVGFFKPKPVKNKDIFLWQGDRNLA